MRIIADWTIGSNGGFDSGEIAGLEINQWVHVVYTHNSNQAKLYVNGNEVSSTDPGGNISWNQDDYAIGARPSGRHPMTGKIDDVGIWSRILTQTEINYLYNGGVDTVSPTVTLSHNASPTTTVSNGDSYSYCHFL